MSLIDETASGLFAIAVTPFSEDGSLDLQSTDTMVDFYLESGCSGLTILGIMGEAQKLLPDEAVAFTKRVLSRSGNIPVVVGVSSPAFQPMERLTKQVMDLGAAGVMLAPMGGLNTDLKIKNYFFAVAEFLGETPVVLQDYPPSSGVNISSNLLVNLFDELPMLKVLKHEDWPGLRKLTEFKRAQSQGKLRKVSVLAGNGGLFLPQELDRGADGAMTGFAFPEMLAKVIKLYAEGAAPDAEDLFDCYLPLCKHEQQLGIGLALRKETLFRRGVLSSPAIRAPGPALDVNDYSELSHLISRLYRRLSMSGYPTDFWKAE